MPYPGVYVTDEQGRVVAKFFHDTYKKRDSPERLIDAALGRVELDPDAPAVAGNDPQVRVTAAIHGGKGSIRQGVMREVVVRFELDPGLHVYGEPVPEGMIPVSIDLKGPPGLVIEETILPPTETLHLESMGIALPTWTDTVDFRIPLYAKGELASECRPLDSDTIEIAIDIRYQACNDEVCLMPTTESLRLELPLEVVDVPALDFHGDHGQRYGNYDGTPHMRRLFLRKARENPIRLIRFIAKVARLELAAKRRRRNARGGEDKA